MTRALRFSLVFAGIAGIAGCSSTDPAASPDGGADPDGGAPRGDASSPEDASAPARCGRKAAPENRVRKVVVSHPYGASGENANQFEVLDLSTTGELSKTNKTFEMGRVFWGEIAFTLDGKVGLVAQDDGTVGVFTFDDAGAVHVVQANFKGDFYAQRVVVAPDGERAFVLDPQTKEHDGGVHELTIGCDGTVTSKGLVVPGGRAHAMAFLPGSQSQALLIAGAALDAPAGSYAHTIDFGGEAPARIASAPVFPDDQAISSWVSVTPDGKYALVTDNGIGVGNRMAPIALDTLKAGTILSTLNPAAVVMSPFNNAALLLNSDGEDALRIVKYDPANAAEPFSITEEVAYKGGKSELPTTAFVIERGSLKGRILVSENVAVRQLTFAADGKVIDEALFSFGEGIPSIVGGLGVQP